MAGDELSSMAGFYYQQNSNGSGGSVTNALLSTLLTAISGSPAGAPVHGQAGAITSQLGGNADFTSFVSSSSTSAGQPPKAYLTIVFFDERFQLLGSESRQDLVDPGRNGAFPLSLLNIRAPKNGYAYVYVSNESDVQAVYFDNLAVVHTRSKLLEEATYYPFGLKITALSAQAFQKPTTSDKLQGVYSDFEEEVGWNDLS